MCDLYGSQKKTAVISTYSTVLLLSVCKIAKSDC